MSLWKILKEELEKGLNVTSSSGVEFNDNSEVEE